MAAETTKPKYQIVDQGSKVTANSENKRIKTVTDANADVSLHIANVPTEDSENKRINKDTYRGHLMADRDEDGIKEGANEGEAPVG